MTHGSRERCFVLLVLAADASFLLLLSLWVYSVSTPEKGLISPTLYPEAAENRNIGMQNSTVRSAAQQQQHRRDRKNRVWLMNLKQSIRRHDAC
jgi:hypothetical protein